jgi:ADP-ribose pyrophosphatase YjhB (NUDIX family)
MTRETHPDIRRTLVFFIKDDQILLAMKKRGFGAGKWNGVGGKIEVGESLEDALVRESIEEVGMKPLAWEPVAELDFIQDAMTDPWHMYVHAYISYEWEGEPTESEEMQPAWYPVKNIPYDSMWEDDQYWLPQVLAGQKLQGKFTFDENDKLMTHELTEISL